MYTCQKADEYIEKNRVDRADKPEFHLTTPVGWLNDPNGFSIYGGKAHLFYQFHPYSTEWGPMHWGHSTSDDFIRWEELPTALAPDSDYDAFGCFSGTAIENDGKHVLFYTGVVEEKLADGTKNVIQNQCMAVGDGISYEKISGNPVVDGKIMPEECSRADFRDPKVWKDADGRYYMLAGNRTYNGIPQVVLFSSDDMYNWKFESVFAKDETGRFGAVWECPDYFETEGRKILSTSVQGLEGGVWDARNVYQSGYFLVEGDILSEYVLSDYELWDYGFDYYAPQSFESEDGRRIHISWMGMPDCEEYTNLTLEDGWQHCFTFPREVHVKDKKVLQQPVKELEALRRGEERAVSVLEKKGTKVFEAEVQNITGNHFRAVLAKELVLEYVNGRFEMKFTSQDKTSVSAGRSLRFREVSEVRNVRILADVSSVEVFVNDGETVFSTRYYPQDYEIKIEALDAKIAFWEL